MNNRGLSKAVIIGIILGALVVLASGFLYFALTDDVSVAILKVNQGEVMVDSGNGYAQVSGEVNLEEGAKVKTGADGKATLVLYESLIQVIQPSSEISLDAINEENPQISLSNGKTWTKFTGLTGMKEFAIDTPNSVAIVRGTGFTTESDGIKVIDGVVEVKSSDGTVYRVEAGKAVVLQSDGTWLERELTAEEKAELVNYLKESVNTLKEIRQGIIDENPSVFDVIKSASGMDDDALMSYLNDMDEGRASVEDIYDQSPVKNEIVSRVAEITRAVQDENKLILSLMQ